MEKITYKWFSEHIHDIVNENCKKVYCVISDVLEVHCGNENDCDLVYCTEHDIPVYQINRCGGTIVCAKGNIGIAAITPVKNGWQCEKFNTAFAEWLRSFGLDVEINNNDILIDGYKVASGMELKVGNGLTNIYSAHLISINQDIEAIQHICKKEMVKIPKALSDYGFTTEQVEIWCNNYFDNLINNN